jgi:hypothetical protein
MQREWRFLQFNSGRASNLVWECGPEKFPLHIFPRLIQTPEKGGEEKSSEMETTLNHDWEMKASFKSHNPLILVTFGRFLSVLEGEKIFFQNEADSFHDLPSSCAPTQLQLQ